MQWHHAEIINNGTGKRQTTLYVCACVCVLFFTHDQNRIRISRHLVLISTQINTEITCCSPAKPIYNLHRSYERPVWMRNMGPDGPSLTQFFILSFWLPIGCLSSPFSSIIWICSVANQIHRFLKAAIWLQNSHAGVMLGASCADVSEATVWRSWKE